MCQIKSFHPALIAIWPPNNADPAAHLYAAFETCRASYDSPPLETCWASAAGVVLPIRAAGVVLPMDGAFSGFAFPLIK
ncbi:hypothetical protein DPMN_092758 [Dreissena polymorpha]|uniref:Uncharacterized protein n=1 Tax=Dreissena polymorpha TaxID=45954 RepID=A0A9D4R0G7_DREPO|nr:hypothetical protein DPMN_092758 [Dreissena polymorpha]